ncbi:hypothetical protein G9A89_012170 [Geosiphon pyriformis]|nr:hypothetical protein G9A89_012170 [Geosiphon pyriformis]
MRKAVSLAEKEGIIINNDMKKQGLHSDWAVVIKEISMDTPKDIIIATKAVVEFADSDQAVQLASRWLFLIGKNSVHVAMAIRDRDTWASRDQFRVLLFTLPAGNTAHDLGMLLDGAGGKTCVINRSLETGNWFHCAMVCFESDEMLKSVFCTEPIFGGIRLSWAKLELVRCGKCGRFRHSALECDASDASPLLAKLYIKKNVPISCPAAFGGKSWAQVMSFVSFSDSSPSGSGLLFNGASLLFGSSHYQVDDLGDHLAVLEQSMEIFFDQVSVIFRKLSFFELVLLASPFCAPFLAVSVHLASVVDLDMALDGVLVSSAPSLSGGGNSAAVFSSSDSKVLTSKMGGLESKMSGLKALFSLILARLNLLCSVWKIVTCNIRGMNNLAKQKNIIRWHKNSGNLVSILMKTKLKDKVHSWLASKFDGVCVFSSGLNSGYVGASVVVIMDNSLAKHVSKISEIPGRFLCIRLLFRNKLLVFVLGLYTGASLTTQFFQTGKVNFLIAMAVNESSFVILGGDFNKNGSHKCASFKRCFDLGLVNSLNGSPFVKAPTWCNSHGVAKTIDYVFVSSNLVGALVDHSVVGVKKFFDTDHKTVSVSVGLSGLLDIQLNSLHKQANKNCWKYDVKSADEIKWSNFRVAMANNVSMFLDEFVTAKQFSNLDAMWDAVCKTIVFSAEGTFRKKWFKDFDSVFNKVSSRFYKLELLVSKLVKSSHLVSVDASSVKSFFLFGSGFDAICSELSKTRKSYYSSKLMQTVKKRIESFEVDKGHTIRSVLECLFHKVVLDHLIVGEELVLEPKLVKSKVDVIMKGWTWKCVVPLDYIFDGTFSNVMCSISFEEMFGVVLNLPDEKVAGLSSITNELWKHCDILVLHMLLVLLNFCLIFRRQESVCGYRLISHFVSKTGHVESQSRLTSFLAAGAFVDDTIWVGSSQVATQYIFDIASEFFSGLPISIAKKGEPHHYLGIFLFSEDFSRPSLAKTHLDVRFFVNLVLKKAISDKQFAYLVSSVLFPIIDYRTQFSFIPVSAESKLAFVIAFANSAGVLGHLFSYRSYDLQVFSWCPHHPLLFPAYISISPSNNFLAGAVHIFSGCDLSLGGSLADAFYLQDGTPMSCVLGEKKTFKCWKRLNLRGSVLFWFDLSVCFFDDVASSFICSSHAEFLDPSDVCQSFGFGVICNDLSNAGANCLSVYTDRSLCNLDTVDMKASAAVFFEDINSGLDVSVSGLVSFTLMELQAIVLVLECIPLFRSVDLFSDSQAALDVYRLESLLKNLDVNWIKVKSHLGILEKRVTQLGEELSKKIESYLIPDPRKNTYQPPQRRSQEVSDSRNNRSSRQEFRTETRACHFCKRVGHLISQCRTRMMQEARENNYYTPPQMPRNQYMPIPRQYLTTYQNQGAYQQQPMIANPNWRSEARNQPMWNQNALVQRNPNRAGTNQQTNPNYQNYQQTYLNIPENLIIGNNDGRVCPAHPNSLPKAVTLARALESAEKEANHSQMVNMVMEENKTETLEKRVTQLGEELSKKIESYLIPDPRKNTYQPPQRRSQEVSDSRNNRSSRQEFRTETRACHFCKRVGHLISQCRTRMIEAQKAIQANNWNDQRAIQTLPFFLKGTANSWYQSLKTKPTSFAEFKNALLEYFSDPNAVIQLQNEFNTIKQNTGETIEAIEQGYYTDPQVLNQFIRRLKSSILGRVCPAHPNSLPKAVTLARALESAEKEANHSQMVNMVMEENKTETLEKRVTQLGEELSKKIESYLIPDPRKNTYQPPQRRSQEVSDKKPYTIESKEKIAQAIFLPLVKIGKFVPVENREELSQTTRGTFGFGSTGKGIEANFAETIKEKGEVIKNERSITLLPYRKSEIRIKRTIKEKDLIFEPYPETCQQFLIGLTNLFIPADKAQWIKIPIRNTSGNCKDSLREDPRQWVDFSSASEKEYINTHNNQELKNNLHRNSKKKAFSVTRADVLAKDATLSAWYLPYLVSERFLKAGGAAVSGNFRHFVRDVFRCYR